jgi:hypothetical protein
MAMNYHRIAADMERMEISEVRNNHRTSPRKGRSETVRGMNHDASALFESESLTLLLPVCPLAPQTKTFFTAQLQGGNLSLSLDHTRLAGDLYGKFCSFPMVICLPEKRKGHRRARL